MTFVSFLEDVFIKIGEEFVAYNTVGTGKKHLNVDYMRHKFSFGFRLLGH